MTYETSVPSAMEAWDLNHWTTKEVHAFFFFFPMCHTAYGILVPEAGIESRPSLVQVWSPNHQIAREFFFSFLGCVSLI